MRLLFAGTPQVAVPTLEALAESPHEVVAVLTRPDAAVGRGRKLTPSPVRERAEELGIEVLTGDPRDPDVIERIRQLKVDCAPVVAYGQILRPRILELPTHGWVNLHFSLLPAWRGAAPVQRAIMAGDEVTGATTFVIEEGLDSGPVLGTLTETVRSRDTAGDLLDRLAHAGAPLMVATMDALVSGQLTPVEQHGDVSYAHKLEIEDAHVDWSVPALAIDRLVRGCTPAPGAWTTTPDGVRLGLGPLRLAEPEDVRASDGEIRRLGPGELAIAKRSVHVGTASVPVLLDIVIPAGKKPMAAADWARGARLSDGTQLSSGMLLGRA